MQRIWSVHTHPANGAFRLSLPPLTKLWATVKELREPVSSVVAEDHPRRTGTRNSSNKDCLRLLRTGLDSNRVGNGQESGKRRSHVGPANSGPASVTTALLHHTTSRNMQEIMKGAAKRSWQNPAQEQTLTTTGSSKVPSGDGNLAESLQLLAIEQSTEPTAKTRMGKGQLGQPTNVSRQTAEWPTATVGQRAEERSARAESSQSAIFQH